MIKHQIINALQLSFPNITGNVINQCLQSAEIVSGGNSGTPILKLTVQDKGYILRLLDNSLKSQQEITCSIVASQYKLCPLVIYPTTTKIKSHFIMMEYLPLPNFQQNDLHNMQELIKQIKCMHEIEEKNLPHSKNYSERIKNYLMPTKFHLKEKIIEAVNNNPFPQKRPKVFCHNDINYHNLLVDKKRVYLIDWADAGINDPIEEIAGFCNEANFSEEQALSFWHHFDKNGTSQELSYYRRLNLMRHSAWAINKLNQLEHAFSHSDDSIRFEAFLAAYRKNKIQLTTIEGLSLLATVGINEFLYLD